MKTYVLNYLLLVAVMSVITLAVYAFDKRRAKTAGRRVSERTLHALAFLGGWPGAMVAQEYLRHKSQKMSFRMVFWLLTILHLALVCVIGYVFIRYSV